MARRRPPVPEPVAPTEAIAPKPIDWYQPLKLTLDAKLSLIRTLESMRARADADLSPLRDKLKLWRDLYEGNIHPGWKPWKDSSEVFFPLVLMIADTALARIFQTFFQQRDVAKCESPMQETDYQTLTNESLSEALDALNRFINHIALEPSELDLKSRFDAAFGECTQVGTVVLRTYHEYLKVKKKVRQPDGSIRIDPDHVETDRICIRPIPLEQCFWDTTAESSDLLRFWGYDYTLSADEIRTRGKQQGWAQDDIDAILSQPDATPTMAFEEAAKREHVDPSVATEVVLRSDGSPYNVSPYARYTMSEVEIRCADVDNDGAYEDVVIVWHRSSRTVPRTLLWPYIHGEMSADVLHYQQRRNRFIGKPPAEALESIAAGVNAVANQTIDAQTVRNCPTLVMPEGEQADLVRDQGWSPGQIYTERSPNEIRTLEFSGSNNTVVSLSIFDRLVDVAHRVAHLGPAQFGDIASAQRIPADVGQSIMSEGNLLLDKVIARARIVGSNVLWKAVSLTWQTQRSKFASVLGAEDARKVETLFNTVGLDRLRVSLNVTSAAHSQELERQNFASMLQVVSNYGRQVFELLNLIQGGTDPKTGAPIPSSPLMQQAASAWLRSTQTLVSQFVQHYPNVTDPLPLVPDVASFVEKFIADEAAKAQQEAMAQAAQAQGGAGGGYPAGLPLLPTGPTAPPAPAFGSAGGSGSLLPFPT